MRKPSTEAPTRAPALQGPAVACAPACDQPLSLSVSVCRLPCPLCPVLSIHIFAYRCLSHQTKAATTWLASELSNPPIPTSRALPLLKPCHHLLCICIFPRLHIDPSRRAAHQSQSTAIHGAGGGNCSWSFQPHIYISHQAGLAVHSKGIRSVFSKCCACLCDISKLVPSNHTIRERFGQS